MANISRSEVIARFESAGQASAAIVCMCPSVSITVYTAKTAGCAVSGSGAGVISVLWEAEVGGSQILGNLMRLCTLLVQRSTSNVAQECRKALDSIPGTTKRKSKLRSSAHNGLILAHSLGGCSP